MFALLVNNDENMIGKCIDNNQARIGNKIFPIKPKTYLSYVYRRAQNDLQYPPA
jgi:hypothetical protein